MAFSLYDATVPNFLQILGSVSGFLEKAQILLHDKGVDPAEIVETRLAPDMLPFSFQILMVTYHSLGAIEAAKCGVRAPPSIGSDLDYAALQTLVAGAHKELSGLTPKDVNALVGGNVTFTIRDRVLEFSTEDFLMSCALPNFYFHAATAYDILRHKGVPLGKLDYIGKMKVKV